MEMEKDPKEAGFLALSANAPFIEVQLSWTHIKSSAMCCLPENDLSPYHMEWNNHSIFRENNQVLPKFIMVRYKAKWLM